MRAKLGFIVAGSILASSSAYAQDAHSQVYKLLLRDGNDAGQVNRDQNGRDLPQRNVYPGGEQAQVQQLASGELLVFGMGSYRLNGALPNNRNQMFCASIKMDPQQGPVVQNLQYVTNNNGDRYRNAHHPRLTPIFGGEALAVSYNYAPNNQGRSYQMVFGAGCQQMSERVQVMAKNNDNCSETGSEPEVLVEQTATSARLLSAHGCNGNGADDSWVAGTRIDKVGPNQYTVTKEYDLSIEGNEERTRPNVMLTGEANFAVVCLTAGNTQPPNKGIRCSGINTQAATPAAGNNGRLLWRQYVAQRQNNGLYYTQVRSRMLPDAQGAPTPQMYLTYQELIPRNNNRKGEATLLSQVVTATSQGLQIENVAQRDIAKTIDATHGTMCDSMYGTDGQAEPTNFVVSGSINGSPNAISAGEFVKWDATTRSLTSVRRSALNAAFDTGWLSNLYGNNPNNQGRNFIKCMGNIQNPGYGVQGGFMPDVKSFVAIPAHTRRMDPATGYAEDKLATELVLVPAVVAAQGGANPDPGTVTPNPDPETDPNPTPTPGADPTPNPDAGPADGAGQAGGCSVAHNGSPDFASFLLLGLALVGFSRRRKNS